MRAVLSGGVSRFFISITGAVAGISLLLIPEAINAQSIRTPWSGYGHDPQHTAEGTVPSQPLNRILWQTPVDLDTGGDTNLLKVHYGSPLITRSNTVIVPVKTGLTGGFRVEALNALTGRTNWMRSTDYILPSPHSWIPSYSPALTPKNRLYFPGGGGTVFYCDTPDATNTSPVFGQIAFYGLANYLANSNTFLSDVFINTPITSDRYGDIFFGFQAAGSPPLGLSGGIARIDSNGNGTWIAAAAINSLADRAAINCAPALSNDQRKLYIAIDSAYNSGPGFLAELDSRTLEPLAVVRLKDVKYPISDALIDGDGTASPTVGPDGDVYYGVLENPVGSNNYRGWLLHFNASLSQLKIPGAFGWDDTASVVPAQMVPSYTNGSPYLLMTKYNNYTDWGGGDGVNKIAILDPRTSMTDPISGATVMKEALTIVGPTPDAAETNTYPNAVREWCINTAAVDVYSKSVLANNEDGKLYRWDLAANRFSETNVLTSGLGEAYTPTIIGVNGIVYAINNGTLFAIGH